MIGDLEAAQKNRERIKQDRLAEKEGEAVRLLKRGKIGGKDTMTTPPSVVSGTESTSGQLERTEAVDKTSGETVDIKVCARCGDVVTPDGLGHKRGCPTKLEYKRQPLPTVKTGRKRTGGYTACADCGAGIYIRRHRLEPDKVYRCRKCASKRNASSPRKQTKAARKPIEVNMSTLDEKIKLDIVTDCLKTHKYDDEDKKAVLVIALIRVLDKWNSGYINYTKQ